MRLRNIQEDLDRHLRSLQNEQAQYIRETGKLRGEVEEKTRLLHEMNSMLSTERTRSMLELSALRERLRKGKKGVSNASEAMFSTAGTPMPTEPMVPNTSNESKNVPPVNVSKDLTTPDVPDNLHTLNTSRSKSHGTPDNTPSPKETPKSTPHHSGSFPSINATPIQRVSSPLSDTKSHGSNRKDSSLDKSISVFIDAMNRVNETMNILQQHDN